MKSSDRFRLHFGPYLPPRCRVGGYVNDVRGRMKVVGIRECRIPWPIVARRQGRSLLLAGGLLKAVRRESSQAIQYWWGVSGSQVWRWRQLLGASANTEGSHRLRVAYGQEPFFKRAQHLAWAKAQDPVRREKIAAAKRGKPRPKHVMELVRRSNIGRRASSETRKRMSEAHRRRGTRPPKAGVPWAAWEDELLRKRTTQEIISATGRTLSAVKSRKRVLRLAGQPLDR